MITVLFESHGTTPDNEAKLASGHHDVPLSSIGEEQARDLGRRYAHRHLDTVYCSDLRRSYDTARLAFEGREIEIVQDPRLRECDYGDWTRYPMAQIEAERLARVTVPFPKGESYEQCAARVRRVLAELRDGRTVLIIGHRATQYGLEHCISGVPLAQAVTAPWRWQPGWTYSLPKVSDLL